MGAKPYPAYKDSGVEWIGEIPEHWEVKKLGFNCRMQSGDFIDATCINESGTYPVYGGNGIRGFSETKNRTGKALLVGRQGALCGNVHLVDGEYWASEHAIVTQPVQLGTHEYMLYMLQWMNLGRYSISAAQPGLSVQHILKQTCIAPPLEEQKLIASFLDRETGKIDTLVEQQQQLITLLKEKRQSLISHTVTKGLNPNVRLKDSGVEWIGEIPEHWEVRKVGRSCVVSPKRNKYLLSNLEQMVCFLPMTAFSNDGTADYSNEVALQSVINGYTYMEFGDIAISKVTPCFENGKGARLSNMPTKVGFGTTEVTAIRPLHICGDFVFYLFRIPEVIDLGVSWMYGVGGLQRIPDAFFEQLEAPYPPLEEQKQIAAFLDTETSKIDQLIDKANLSIALLKERRSSLISAAVTGKIDVREAA